MVFGRVVVDEAVLRCLHKQHLHIILSKKTWCAESYRENRNQRRKCLYISSVVLYHLSFPYITKHTPCAHTYIDSRQLIMYIRTISRKLADAVVWCTDRIRLILYKTVPRHNYTEHVEWDHFHPKMRYCFSVFLWKNKEMYTFPFHF